MSTTIVIILLLAALALIIGVILSSRDGGPRVTQIDRTIERKKENRD